MTTTIIIVFCSLLLLAYLFNITASKTKIPSVIPLLLLGWGIKKATLFWGLSLPNISSILPILATIGLVLIVLEGSLELKLNRSKVGMIRKSLIGAFLSIVALTFLFTYLFQVFGVYSFKDSLINAIPFSIISSAIAIPSVRNLLSSNREFIIYESSLSDIMGVLFFNFLLLNERIDIYSFGFFGLQLFIISIVSLIATIVLALLLSKIDHHVKFIPIILLIILIYTVLDVYHLPALIFILLFGVSIRNLVQLKQFKWIETFNTKDLKKEIQKFKALTIEGAFLIRALFFILFGYLLEMSEILNTGTFKWSFGIVLCIFVFRAIQLKLSKLPLMPLLFIAPRGLITILLFLLIKPEESIFLVDKSLIVQVVILTTLIMTFGLIFSAQKKKPKLPTKLLMRINSVS